MGMSVEFKWKTSFEERVPSTYHRTWYTKINEQGLAHREQDTYWLSSQRRRIGQFVHSHMDDMTRVLSSSTIRWWVSSWYWNAKKKPTRICESWATKSPRALSVPPVSARVTFGRVWKEYWYARAIESVAMRYGHRQLSVRISYKKSMPSRQMHYLKHPEREEKIGSTLFFLFRYWIVWIRISMVPSTWPSPCRHEI